MAIMLRFFFQRQQPSPQDMQDTPFDQHNDPYLEQILKEMYLLQEKESATITNQQLNKEGN